MDQGFLTPAFCMDISILNRASKINVTRRFSVFLRKVSQSLKNSATMIAYFFLMDSRKSENNVARSVMSGLLLILII